MTVAQNSSGGNGLIGFFRDVARWYEAHKDEIQAFVVWNTVKDACKDTGLYAPVAPAWQRIADAEKAGSTTAEMEALILSLYGPGGEAHDALRDELLTADLLNPRQREVEEVLDSLADGRNYVATCGALPLVEFVLSAAAGKWREPRDYELRKRLHEPLSADDEGELLIHYAAVEMLSRAIPEVWKDTRHPAPGAITTELNRHLVLHGTGVGWDNPDNAVRAVLLLAAAARVAEPLLGPR
jgi:hypothetical protein